MMELAAFSATTSTVSGGEPCMMEPCRPHSLLPGRVPGATCHGRKCGQATGFTAHGSLLWCAALARSQEPGAMKPGWPGSALCHHMQLPELTRAVCNWVASLHGL